MLHPLIVSGTVSTAKGGSNASLISQAITSRRWDKNKGMWLAGILPSMPFNRSSAIPFSHYWQPIRNNVKKNFHSFPFNQLDSLHTAGGSLKTLNCYPLLFSSSPLPQRPQIWHSGDCMPLYCRSVGARSGRSINRMCRRQTWGSGEL